MPGIGWLAGRNEQCFVVGSRCGFGLAGAALAHRQLTALRSTDLNDLHGWAVCQYAMSETYLDGLDTRVIGPGWNDDLQRNKKLPAPKCGANLTDAKYEGEVEDDELGVER